MNSSVVDFFKSEPFQSLETHFAKQMIRIEGKPLEELYMGAALVCYEMSKGNICVDLEKYSGISSSGKSDFKENEKTIDFPELKSWVDTLATSKVVGEAGNAKTPLILENNESGAKLYLNRYWQYESKLALSIRSRLEVSKASEAIQQIQENRLEQLFPASPSEDTNWQKKAAESALTNRFSVITGGPGTGKTTIVVKLLALLLELQSKSNAGEFNYSLVAPTGKAASRLRQSILERKKDLLKDNLISPEIANQIHAETSTIQRLLGYIPGSVNFRHNADNLLSLDCLIVDEASMVDLALMSKLIGAVPADSRIILLGDDAQLASVEAGFVLGDICKALRSYYAGSNYVVKLLKSHRFDSEEGIGKLSFLVNQKHSKEAFELLESGKEKALHWINSPKSSHLKSVIKSQILTYYPKLLQSQSAEEAFNAFNEFMVLCALRRGFWGAENINLLIEQILVQEGIIKDQQFWYAGKPILITTNDYQHNLYNGDIGITLINKATDEPSVYFEIENEYKAISPYRLPRHETAYAMTVHKAQGSEFNHISLILPPTTNRILTKELIYTGITRARKTVTLMGTRESFQNGVKLGIERMSGLEKKLIPKVQ